MYFNKKRYTLLGNGEKSGIFGDFPDEFHEAVMRHIFCCCQKGTGYAYGGGGI